MATTLTDVLTLRYGQKIRLRAVSAYVKASNQVTSTSEWGIGYYEKNGRHGILSCVPPLGPKADHLFNEDEYLVLDPTNQRSSGDVVEYGHTLVLVNQHGMVWNNKTGGITGYIGPRPRNIAGEMYVSFRRGNPVMKKDKRSATMAGGASSSTTPQPMLDRETTTGASTSALLLSNGSMTSMAAEVDSTQFIGGAVRYGDENVVISVVESNRSSQMFNKHLSNFKKPTSKIIGGYICCDGKGSTMSFTISPAKPKVEQISMLNKLITAYNYGQKIALPLGLLEKGLQQAEIFFKLSNQTTAILPGRLLQEKMLEHALAVSKKRVDDADEDSDEDSTETEFYLPLKNGPGELVVKLTGLVPRRVFSKLAANKGLHLDKTSSGKPTKSLLPRKLTPLQKFGAIIRKVPVPVFALLYAVLTHFLWSGMHGSEAGVQQELMVAILIIVPAFYIAVKVDHHPLSSLFHPPAPHDTALDSDEPSATASLKLIITEYRFHSHSDKSAASSAASSAIMSSVDVIGGSSSALDAVVPRRYILAEKGDEVKGRDRYLATMAWRKEKELDTILTKPWPHFKTIKTNYPHFYHKRGKNGEPVYYEKPGKINMKALKGAGLTLKDLMHNYLMVSEFLWQVLEPDDNRKCISVLDVEGIGISDFAGEAVEYVRAATAVSGSHYPERCAYIFIINAPSWFSIIWNTVKTMVDEVTRQKVTIISSKKKILEALSERIPLANIPEEYGGESVGRSKEETLLFDLMAHLNGDPDGPKTNPVPAYMAAQKQLQVDAVNGSSATAAVPMVTAKQ